MFSTKYFTFFFPAGYNFLRQNAFLAIVNLKHNKMDLSKILTISGKPGLFQLISQTKTGAIVESLLDGKRMPVFQTDRISSLNEICMFTTGDDYALREVFRNMYVKENQQPISDEKKSLPKDKLFAYFNDFLPDVDTERVHVSDMKKAISWYNLLLSKGLVDDKTEEEKPSEEENAEKQ